MGVFKEIPNADGSGVTQFFRINQSKSTVETKEQGDFYIFKGQVSSRENLPTSGNKIGDTYYIEKENKTVFWTGSKWSEVDAYFKYRDRIKISQLEDIILDSTYSKFKLVISVQQTGMVLYEHEVTLVYVSQLSMCEKAFGQLGIIVEE